MKVDEEVVVGYKFLCSDNTSKNGSAGRWIKNRWKHHQGETVLCEQGFHACTEPFDALGYVYGDVFCIVEAKGDVVYGDDKFVARSMRVKKFFSPELTKRLFVEFSIVCAERTIEHFEKEFPDDKRSREAILAAKRWLTEPTDENRKKAESAARSAAASAAWSAAWSAARSAARSAAQSAVWSAARSAVWSAARSAARSDERKWQEKKLKKIIRKYEKVNR